MWNGNTVPDAVMRPLLSVTLEAAVYASDIPYYPVHSDESTRLRHVLAITAEAEYGYS